MAEPHLQAIGAQSNVYNTRMHYSNSLAGQDHTMPCSFC